MAHVSRKNRTKKSPKIKKRSMKRRLRRVDGEENAINSKAGIGLGVGLGIGAGVGMGLNNLYKKGKKDVVSPTKEDVIIKNEQIIETPTDLFNLQKKFEQKFKKNVCQIICYVRQNNPFTPYLETDYVSISGSGFIYDIDNGIILTNAHVMTDSLHSYALFQNFGRKKFILELVSICLEKDLALCRLQPEDIKELKGSYSSDEINLKFIQGSQIYRSQEVFAVGFPLGERDIKITKGTISGYNNNSFNENNKIIGDEDSCTYIQMDAAINPGNSGGPLVDKNGLVVGINSAGIMFMQNIGYAIGVKTILSIYDELKRPLLEKLNKPYMINIARYSFTYNSINNDMKENYAPDASGIYISNVYKNSSFFNVLKEEDILSQIEYDDKNDHKIILKIANDATVTINYVDLKMMDDTKFVIKQVFDFIKNGAKLKLTVYRKNERGRTVLECPFLKNDTVYFNKIKQSEFEKFDYIFCCGMCIGELTFNHVQGDMTGGDLSKYIEGKNRFKKFLIINKIFPGTEISRNEIFKNGDILKSVNGVEVSSIEDLRNAIKKNGEKIKFVNEDNTTIVVSRNNYKDENEKIYKQIVGNNTFESLY